MNTEISSPSSAPMGVEHAGVIDRMMHDAKRGTVTLVMVEPRIWDGSEERCFQLQEKLNTYASFALDGEFSESYPDLGKLPLTILLECVAYPDEPAIDLLEKVRNQLAFQNIDLQVLVKEAPASSS